MTQNPTSDETFVVALSGTTPSLNPLVPYEFILSANGLQQVLTRSQANEPIFAEFGHPNLNAFDSNDETVLRFMTIKIENVCCALTDLHVDESTQLLMATARPMGVYKEAVTEELRRAAGRRVFGIRGWAKPINKEDPQIHYMEQVVCWDFMGIAHLEALSSLPRADSVV